MSIDYNSYVSFDPGLLQPQAQDDQHGQHTDQQLGHVPPQGYGAYDGAGGAGGHRYQVPDANGYSSYAPAGPSSTGASVPSQSYAEVPRYGGSQHPVQHGQQQPSQSFSSYGGHYIYPQSTPYPDSIGQTFDMGRIASHHHHPHQDHGQQQHQQPSQQHHQQQQQQQYQQAQYAPYSPTVPSSSHDPVQHDPYADLQQQQQQYQENGFGVLRVTPPNGGLHIASQYQSEYHSPDAVSFAHQPAQPQLALPDRAGAHHAQIRYGSHTSSSASPPHVQHTPPRPSTGNIVVDHHVVPIQSPLSAGLSVSDELALLKLQSPANGSDLVSFIRPYLDAYINAPNRIAFGERTVIVMSSKVAQKSYGSEKRFLCPPPMAVFLGNNWWSEISRPGHHDHGKLMPPHVVVSISGEPIPSEVVVEWSGANARTFDPATDVPDPDVTTFIGRAVGKQLFISEADEKRKKVDALIHVSAPNIDDGPERVIGVFKSRPIKVISKPSKKRQSAKNLELCINHGSTVALFHRLRAQTVSTKYLCVAGSGSAFKGSDGQPLYQAGPASTISPTFAARTTSWDSFIVYIVDIRRPGTNPDGLSLPPPSPEYPAPPANAVPFTVNGAPVPIYYNQTIVLQCLTSGVVSPTLIIRKVDHSTTVVGGGQEAGTKNVSDQYCAPGEVCGDPVSQLHKIALEVYDPTKATPEYGHTGTTNPFLACMGEKVNTHMPEDVRSWNAPAVIQQNSPASHNSASLPGSPIVSTPTSASADVDDQDYPTADGGRVKKTTKRTSSREGRAPNNAKNRRRQNSTGSNRGGSGNESGGRDGSTPTYSSGSLWGIDVGETSIWTIVGTDQVRYNFYVPPKLRDPSGDAQPYKQPVPTRLVTPFPDVVKFLPPDRAAEAPKQHSVSANGVPFREAQARMLTLYGTNFNREDPMTVFFGSEPSPMVEVRCQEVLACLPPEKTVPQRRPMLLVRNDGVVYPSSCLYP